MLKKTDKKTKNSLNTTITANIMLLEVSPKEEFIKAKLDWEDIDKIVKGIEINKISNEHNHLIFKFYEAAKKFYFKEGKLSFDDIVEINKMITHRNDNKVSHKKPHGQLKEIGGGYVLFFEKKEKNESKKSFLSLIDQLESTDENEKRVSLILKFSIEMIVQHWFENGNNRTALITCNKLLLDYCCENDNNLLLLFNSTYFQTFLCSCLNEIKNIETIVDNIHYLPKNGSFFDDFVVWLKGCIEKSKLYMKNNRDKDIIYLLMNSFFNLQIPLDV